MPVRRVLLVKMSSLGDVVHNFPVVSDLSRQIAGLHIDWAVEEAYVDLVRLHPDVCAAHPIPLRRLRAEHWRGPAWRDLAAARRRLQGLSYDLILDTQGLLKSAWVAGWANGPIAGFDRRSAREPLGVWRYQRRIAVSTDLHAVERNRRLAAAALGYRADSPPDYGLTRPPTTAVARDPYAVLLHATSRADKRWPQSHWLALGEHLLARGITPVLPWGSAEERRTSDALASALGTAQVPDRLSLPQAAGLLKGARCVVGVDTGLAHLAVALGTPTVGLYVHTSPARTGLYGSSACNLGIGHGAPSVAEVIAALPP
jgi:heptosyltransferase-1